MHGRRPNPIVGGEDVGPHSDTNLSAVFSHYTFQSMRLDTKQKKRIKDLRARLTRVFSDQPESSVSYTPVYRFRHGPLATTSTSNPPPHETHFPNFDLSQPPEPEDFEWIPPDENPNWPDGSTQSAAVDDERDKDTEDGAEGMPLSKGEGDALIILARPVFQAPDLMSRGTRCFAAVLESDFESSMDVKNITIRTLKLSWQYYNHKHEAKWYQKVQGVDYSGQVPHVARAISAGWLGSSTSCEKKSTDIEPKSFSRRLDWLVLDRIGVPLRCFTSTKEMSKVVRNAIKGMSFHSFGFTSR